MSMFAGRYDYTTRDYHKRGPVTQRKWEISQLVKIYRELKPEMVMEIGVMDCGTLNLWIKHAVNHATIFGLDTRPFEHKIEQVSDGRTILINQIVGNSHEIEFTLTAGNHLDFLFIDGDHTEEGATLDFEMYGPLVRPGGIIAFHDIIDPAPYRNQDHIRVSRLWERIQRAGYVTRELVANPGQDWGGIGVVYV